MAVPRSTRCPCSFSVPDAVPRRIRCPQESTAAAVNCPTLEKKSRCFSSSTSSDALHVHRTGAASLELDTEEDGGTGPALGSAADGVPWGTSSAGNFA